ncbi:MAG: sugar-binding protein [Saprospiraceae bacterium]|nr:sugar-binding protein [Saprospiraceae bacterium]
MRQIIHRMLEKLRWKTILSVLLLGLFIGCKSKTSDKGIEKPAISTEQECHQSDSSSPKSMDNGYFMAFKTEEVIVVDGCSKDAIWSKTRWNDMNHVWLGGPVDSEDYSGRFKLSWDVDQLYILVEVVDDVLNPTLKDGKDNYWKGDYVEVFIDEDKSGGDHKFNHQAFAYHVSTEGHAIDKDTKEQTVFFDDHVTVARSNEGNTYLWEMSIRLYDAQFDENSKNNIPVKIHPMKAIGFSIAYGDNDGKGTREHFVGCKKTHGNNNDDGYINSDVFGKVIFTETP